MSLNVLLKIGPLISPHPPHLMNYSLSSGKAAVLFVTTPLILIRALRWHYLRSLSLSSTGKSLTLIKTYVWICL